MTTLDDLPTWLHTQITERRVHAENVRDTWVVFSSFERIKASVKHLANRDDVLAQCEAYEKLLRPHHLVHDEEHGFFCNGCGYNVLERPRTRHSLDHCPVWRGVALAFQHQPGYREEWRP